MPLLYRTKKKGKYKPILMVELKYAGIKTVASHLKSVLVEKLTYHTDYRSVDTVALRCHRYSDSHNQDT